MQNAAKTYFQTQFATVGQGELLILLYDGAIKFLNKAKEHIVAKDVAAKGIAISKALDIVGELDSTLNPEAGGDLAANLHQLYMICSMRLLKANIHMDMELIDSVIAVLSGLRSAYAEILHTPEAQAASRQISARQNYYESQAHTPINQPGNIPPAMAAGARAQMAYNAVASQSAPAKANTVPINSASNKPTAVQPGNRAANMAYNRAIRFSA